MSPHFLRQQTANSILFLGSHSDLLTIRAVTLHTSAAMMLLKAHQEESEAIIYPHV